MKKVEKDIYFLYENRILNEVGMGSASWLRKAFDAMHGYAPGEVGWYRRLEALKSLGAEYEKYNFYKSLYPKFAPLFNKKIAQRPVELQKMAQSIVQSPEFQALGIVYRAIYKAASQNNIDDIKRIFDPACQNIINLLYKKTGGIDKNDLETLILEPTAQDALNRLKELMPLPSNISISVRYYILVAVVGYFTTKLAIFTGTLLSFAISGLELGQEIIAGGEKLVEGGTEAVRKLNELVDKAKDLLGLESSTPSTQTTDTTQDQSTDTQDSAAAQDSSTTQGNDGGFTTY